MDKYIDADEGADKLITTQFFLENVQLHPPHGRSITRKSFLCGKDRKICSLSLFDKRVDPTLHLINKQLDGSVLLFVVGGYEVPNLMQDVQVFSLNFQRNMTLQPVIRIKLRYPRLQPLIYHMKISEENDTRIYILGGTSFKSLKKEFILF